MTAARSGPTRRGRPRARRAAGARVSTRGPLRIGHFERYKSHGARPMNAGEADVGERGRFAAAPRRAGLLCPAMRNLLAVAALVLAFLLGVGLAWHFAHRE